MKFLWKFSLLLLVASTTGCGSFIAHRMVSAPNRYPSWLRPTARVSLGFGSKFLTNFPSYTVEVGPPEARLFYRIIEPADYHLRINSTNWVVGRHKRFNFSFKAQIPAKTNDWTANPRGTIVLLHGYGLAQFAMAPWAVRLAEDGWRCVLVDLRGHGKSTGKKIFYGTREVNDMKQLLDAMTTAGQLREPVAVFGESYGAAIALRWKGEDARVEKVIAIAPYSSLSDATANLCHDYAPWIPGFVFRAGVKKLPRLLDVPPEELNTPTVLKRHPVSALYIAASEDRVASPEDVRNLAALSPGSKVVVVPDAPHEAVTYFFDDLEGPIEDWLGR
jgi:pimeloyl-ACP methyl ester carboxylesterase